MAGPILVACLVALRTEFNTKYPRRDKGADGWIGDKAHQQESSDHNPDETGKTPYQDADKIDEVHAIDIDKDVKDGDLNVDVETIRLRHQRGEDDRLQNIIWRGRIASRSWGWVWHEYNGASAHFDHAHFSARYTTEQENDTSAWGVLEEDDMGRQDVADFMLAVAASVTGDYEGVPDSDDQKAAYKKWRQATAAIFRFSWGLNAPDQVAAKLAPGRLDKIDAQQAVTDAKVQELQSAVADAVSALTAINTKLDSLAAASQPE